MLLAPPSPLPPFSFVLDSVHDGSKVDPLRSGLKILFICVSSSFYVMRLREEHRLLIDTSPAFSGSSGLAGIEAEGSCGAVEPPEAGPG